MAGGVPAVLAAILAHLRRVEVLRAALIVLRNIVADDHSAMRLGGQGAYRYGFACHRAMASVCPGVRCADLASSFQDCVRYTADARNGRAA